MYRLKREINSDEFTRPGRHAVWRGDSTHFRGHNGRRGQRAIHGAGDPAPVVAKREGGSKKTEPSVLGSVATGVNQGRCAGLWCLVVWVSVSARR